MAEDTEKTSEDAGEAPSRSPEKETPARSEHASAPGSQFDHARAWDDAFKKLMDMPEAILNALEERASSRKKEEKEPEEKVVQQEEAKERPDEAPTPGKKGETNASARKPWGHTFLERGRK